MSVSVAMRRDPRKKAHRGAVPKSPSPGKDVTSESKLPKTAEEIYHAYAPRVYAVACRLLGNREDAEDVTQDVLVQVIRKLDSFQGRSELTTWLHRITVNAVLQHRRKESRRHEQPFSGSLEVLLNGKTYSCSFRPSVAPDQRMLLKEMRERIEAAIARLPNLYRVVFVLADLEGLSNEAIGQMFNVSVAAVKSRLHRARQMMRKFLEPFVYPVN